MRWSRYNHLFSSLQYGDFIYNSVTNSFVKIEKELFSQLKNVTEWNESSINSFPKEFQEILYKHKIIVPNNFDDEYYLKKKYAKLSSAFNTDVLSLTIATTTGCNFACPYCFEKGAEPVTMDEKIEECILAYVKNAPSRFLYVTWYGGEPLLNFPTIERLSQSFKALSKFESIRYSIITNGYYLTDEKISFFSDYDVTSIQTTIDGLAETHNQLRRAKNGQPTFETIVANIENAAQKLPKCHFHIRVNINKQNGDEYALLYTQLSERWKGLKNITIYCSFVEDYGKCDVDCYNSNEKINFMRTLRNKYGIFTKNFYPRSNLSLCVANSRYGYVISANGDLYKCWSDLGKPDKVVGNIIEGKLNNYELLAHYALDMDKFGDERCRTCFLFPVCSGSCPQHRYTTWKKEQKHDICPYEAVNIDSVLEMIYEDYLRCKQKYSV